MASRRTSGRAAPKDQRERRRELEVLYQSRSAWAGPVLCVTHSDRPVDLDRCDLSFLQQRYSRPDRLPPSEPFESLRPSIESSPHLGAVTLWGFQGGHLERPELLAHLRPHGYKAQHAIRHNNRLWILGVELLEAYDASFELTAVIEDPWLAGAHTIVPDGRGRLLLACAASDSVLIVEEECPQVVKALRVPESIYGSNYSLSRSDSVVEHFIDNDKQLTHVNCAWPWRDGIVISTLIQGAIGWFDPQDRYQELLRGYVGCHGVRCDNSGQLYFSDSCRGAVVHLNASLEITARLDAHSRWLHDAQRISDTAMALAVADRNTVEIVDLETGGLIASIDGGNFGASTQFLWFSS